MAFAYPIVEGEKLFVKKLCVVSLLILIIAGCGTRPSSQSTPSPTPVPSLPGPTPTSTVPSPTPVPTPLRTKGAITGRLIGRESGRPEEGLVVYLGEVTYLEPTPIPVIAMKQQTSPHTGTDDSGHFAFLDLDPGTYALILWTPMNSVVINDPETGEGLFVTVQAGAITDLGEITTDLP